MQSCKLEPPLNSFDYLRSARPLLPRRIIEFRIPHHLHGAVAALVTALAVVWGAWFIESARLSEALRTQAQYEQRFQNSEAAVRRANVYYTRVSNLVSLDTRVRDIVSSGDYNAQQIAAIGNAIPTRAWLTSITRDGHDIILDGDARGLAALGEVFRSLAGNRTARTPVLVKAEAVTVNGADQRYTVRLRSLGT